jgi:RimJ/RimL family protein N-acetyltransferase
MKRLVLDDKERINAWLWQRVGRESPFSPPAKFNGFGVEKNGELIAGVIFDSFSANARCSMHCAGIGKHWLTREFLNVCFDYAFNQANCKVVINTIAAKNVASINFTKHCGFKVQTVITDGAGDDDLVILVLHRDNCRFLEKTENVPFKKAV